MTAAHAACSPAAVVAATFVRRAEELRDAYPQFQMSRDQTCTGCHISPAGGGLLNENGLTTAEAISQWGTAPEFFYGKIPTPSWLVARRRPARRERLRPGARRSCSPASRCRSRPTAARRSAQGFSLYVDLGARSVRGRQRGGDPRVVARALLHVAAEARRDHRPVRARRPVHAGVRAALRRAPDLHPRRYGGTPLYAETYGARGRVHRAEVRGPRDRLHQGSADRHAGALERRRGCSASTG